jgi:hypothetical protein
VELFEFEVAAGSKKNCKLEEFKYMILVGSEGPKYVIFLHDCPFKGLGSLPKFLDLTPRCQIDSPLHHPAVRFDSPLHHAVVRFGSLLHFAAVRSDPSLQDAAESHISTLQNAVGDFTPCFMIQREDF